MSFDYTLAKELWDSKFPYVEYLSQRQPVMGDGSPRLIIPPTLEELIEALQKDGHVYTIVCYAHGFVIARDGLDDMRICDTPTEAVARLWLALHKQ